MSQLIQWTHKQTGHALCACTHPVMRYSLEFLKLHHLKTHTLGFINTAIGAQWLSLDVYVSCEKGDDWVKFPLHSV